MFLFHTEKEKWIEVSNKAIDQSNSQLILNLTPSSNINLQIYESSLVKIGSFANSFPDDEESTNLKYHFHIMNKENDQVYDFGGNKASILGEMKKIVTTMSLNVPNNDIQRTIEEPLKKETSNDLTIEESVEEKQREDVVTNPSILLEVKFKTDCFLVKVTAEELESFQISDLKRRIFLLLLSSNETKLSTSEDFSLFINDSRLYEHWFCNEFSFHSFSKLEVKLNFKKNSTDFSKEANIKKDILFVLHFKDYGKIEVHSMDNIEQLAEIFAKRHEFNEEIEKDIKIELFKGVAGSFNKEVKHLQIEVLNSKQNIKKSNFNENEENSKLLKEAAKQIHDLQIENKLLKEKLLETHLEINNLN